MNAFELLVEVEPEPTDTDTRSAIVVRCLGGSVKVGDLISAIYFPTGCSVETQIQVADIERYEGVFVDEIDSNHIARIHLRGKVPETTTVGCRLIGKRAHE